VIAPCPYCTTDVESDGAMRCTVCHAAHHPDCWDENHGCAVAACLGGPAPGDAGPRPVPRSGRPALVVDIEDEPPVVEAASSRDARRRAQRRAWVTVAVIAACMVVLIAVLALAPTS
jgi:hypothetical protein